SSGAGVHGLSRAASAAHRLSGAAATVGDLARRHRPFTAVLVVAALLRAAVFFAYRPALIFPDSGRYLEYAFRFARGWIIPDTMRASGYSFLLLPMGWWHYLGLAPLFQHAFGLASGVLVYALLVRRGSRRSVAMLAALPVLFDPLELNLEQYILPDTIAAFCILAAVAVLVWRGRELSRRAAAGAGGLLLLATVMRLPDLVLVAPVLVYLAATVRPWRLMAARAGVLVAVVAIPLVAYMGWFAGTRGQWTLTTYSGRFLYGRVARFADCQGLSLPSYERSLCPRRPLGHRASEDFYMWYPQSPQWTYRPPPGMVAEKVILDFSLRVVAHQPLAYAHVVADNLGYGFWPWRGSGPDNYPQ
ncbi:MAG: phospholipid carrier-dependent glycosyltransferase, partial [Actinomycetes bacterium]